MSCADLEPQPIIADSGPQEQRKRDVLVPVGSSPAYGIILAIALHRQAGAHYSASIRTRSLSPRSSSIWRSSVSSASALGPLVLNSHITPTVRSPPEPARSFGINLVPMRLQISAGMSP